MGEWNPRWLEFLRNAGTSLAEVGTLTRQARIRLNAEFMCWNMAAADAELNRVRKEQKPDGL